ncbi:MAG: glycosyltransferase family 2 protein [Gammaproteobacteria bacterium]|nr:glycosyltransferase family 2 protein [Gammaproteobacteria bacterium]MBT8445030.1 glycosyltransferase family 2 protein [Gammaproteobacteria bacterium]NND37916.1 glycosyltransferase family 2 protein [Gammaproteobacteria bacterium]
MTIQGTPPPISAVIIARDAEATIGATLESLKDFAEVIVYDNGSADRTKEIAERFPNVRLYEGEFTGFGPTKNRAAELAEHDWVFSIDSDERASPELLESIARCELDDPATACEVLRVNYLKGKPVRHSGWGGDWLLRLYNRRGTGVSDAAVHEVVQVPTGGRVIRLNGELSHEAVRELGQFLVKIDRYSELFRTESPRMLPVPIIFLRSVWTFIRVYVFQLGFLDGWRGLVIAVGDANGVFFKYMKAFADAND